METFEAFGSWHKAALGATVALAGLLAGFARVAGGRGRARLRVALAAAMVAGSLAEVLVGLAGRLASFRDLAPLQLCDLALLLGAASLVTLRPRLLEPFVCFALTGTILALLSPELPGRVTTFRFASYFVLHGLTVVAALVAVVGLRLRPAPGTWWRALVGLNAYAACISVINVVAGTNYLYLRAKPVTASPLDWMGPWPFYLVTLELVCAGLFVAVESGWRAATRTIPGCARPPGPPPSSSCSPQAPPAARAAARRPSPLRPSSRRRPLPSTRRSTGCATPRSTAPSPSRPTGRPPATWRRWRPDGPRGAGP
jgi:hypothetical integral membrane protein (TIGR02206 family)